MAASFFRLSSASAASLCFASSAESRALASSAIFALKASSLASGVFVFSRSLRSRLNVSIDFGLSTFRGGDERFFSDLDFDRDVDLFLGGERSRETERLLRGELRRGGLRRGGLLLLSLSLDLLSLSLGLDRLFRYFLGGVRDRELRLLSLDRPIMRLRAKAILSN